MDEEHVQEHIEENLTVGDLMQESLKKASSDATEFKDKYFRALAEMENLRKRLQQEKQDMISYAIDNMLGEFLTPLDSFEGALKFTDNLSDELKNWAHGFKMILSQFKHVLESHGITTFNSVGQKFDPHFHEAIEMIETSDHEDGTVIEEIQKGYKQKERVLRVATVRVAKSKDSHN
jgi:molecular chaperone GrpE